MAITNFAQEVYSSDSPGTLDLIPRQRFNFTLQLTTHDRAIINYHKVSEVTQPSFSVDGQLMNQYNKKRFVQTRINYDPITVSFYDTFDDQWYNIMRDYFAHYYNGTEGLTSRTQLEGTSTVEINFETDLGFTPNATRNFFPEIRIIQNGIRGRHRGWILKQPYITSVTGDTMNYSDSNPVQWAVTFQPESVQTYVESSQFDDGIEPSRSPRPSSTG